MHLLVIYHLLNIFTRTWHATVILMVLFLFRRTIYIRPITFYLYKSQVNTIIYHTYNVVLLLPVLIVVLWCVAEQMIRTFRSTLVCGCTDMKSFLNCLIGNSYIIIMLLLSEGPLFFTHKARIIILYTNNS